MSNYFIIEKFSKPAILHKFFTNKIDNSTHKYVEKEASKKNLSNEAIKNNHKQILKQFLPAEKINVSCQIHSNKVIVLEENFPFMQEPEADAMVTNKKDIVLGVISADCVPILFADFENKIIGAAHAGWRGAKADIIANTIKKMKELGANEISASIGPCIKQKNYEVDRDFYKNFLAENIDNKNLFIPSDKDNHYFFDLTQYVKNKLINENIKQIYDVNIDTYSNKDCLFSFRRYTHYGGIYGSNISVIVIRNAH